MIVKAEGPGGRAKIRSDEPKHTLFSCHRLGKTRRSVLHAAAS